MIERVHGGYSHPVPATSDDLVERADELIARTAESRRYVDARWDEIEARVAARSGAAEDRLDARRAAQARSVLLFATIALVVGGAAISEGDAGWLALAAVVGLLAVLGAASVARSR